MTDRAGEDDDYGWSAAYLIRRRTFRIMLAMVAMPITTTIPYQKSVAYWLAMICRIVSSKISCWKLYAWVKLEKSTPESFRGVKVIDDDDPLSMSILKRSADSGSLWRTLSLRLTAPR